MNYAKYLFGFIAALLMVVLTACGNAPASTPAAPQSGATSDRTVAHVTVAPPSVTLTADICLLNTRTVAECKDCCDSLAATGEMRKTCRDACPGHDFSQNANFVVFQTPSVLGPTGDYSACTSLGSEQACKACCDGSADLQSGDRRFCRDACARTHIAGKQPGVGFETQDSK